MFNPALWVRGSLLRRLVGPSFLLSMMVVVLVGGLSYYNVRKALLDHSYVQLKSSLDQHEAELKRWISDQKQYFVFLSRVPFFREHVADMLYYERNHHYYKEGYKALSEFLFSYNKIIPGVREIMFLSGKDGRVLISTHRENEGTSRAEYPFFAKGKEDMFVQGVYAWKDTGEPAISVVKPLRGASGTYQGVLVVHLDLDRMAEVVFGNSGLGYAGETYIVDRRNRMVRASQPGHPEFLQEAHSEGIRLAVKGRQGVGLYENYAGVPVVGAYRWLPELKVALLAEISQEEVLFEAREFGLLISAIGLFLSGLLYLAILFVSQRIANPLRELSQATLRVAEGDLSATINVRNEDEVGLLAESFNRMVARLNELYGKQQASLTYFSTVFQLSPNAIAVQDFKTGVFTATNESFNKLFGYAADEVIGRSAEKVNISGSKMAHLKMMAALRKNNVVQRKELEFRRRDGSTFSGMLSSRLISLDGMTHAITVFWDMTEQLRAEEELRNSKERLQLLIDRMPIGFIAWNSRFEVVLWNPAAQEIFGFTSSEALGRHANDLLVPEEVLPQVEIVYQRLLNGDSTAHSENANITKDGRTIMCDWYNTPLRDQAGNTIGAVSMVRDITQRKATEEELERYHRHLEELVSERTRQLEEAQSELLEKERLAVLGQLTATVSHELRNPLGTIANAIFSVRNTARKEQMENIEKALVLAERNVYRCDNIISELLDFSRSHELIREPLELSRWLVGLLEEQRFPREIDVQLDLPAGFVVRADKERLRRAVINVLDNAVQAIAENPQRKGRLAIDLRREEQRIGIVMSDNGPGIPAEVHHRIFEPLFSTKGFGVGLGMAVVKNIVEDHGGRVSVDSVPGEGSTVTLWIPAGEQEAQTDGPCSDN